MVVVDVVVVAMMMMMVLVMTNTNTDDCHDNSVILFMQIIVEGVRGTSYTGDIAVDDFKFRNGRCSIVPAAANPGYNCNFENGLCTWTQATTGDTFDWTRNQGSTISSGTGPSTDHTLGNSE